MGHRRLALLGILSGEARDEALIKAQDLKTDAISRREERERIAKWLIEASKAWNAGNDQR